MLTEADREAGCTEVGQATVALRSAQPSPAIGFRDACPPMLDSRTG